MKKLITLTFIVMLSSCGWLGFDDPIDVTDNKLPYWLKLNARSTSELNMVVIHATELTDMVEAREYGERVLYDNETGASGHYYIDRDGTIEQYVPDNRIANHTSGWNSKTLSIELVNRGRYPNWYHSDHQVMQESYPEAQIEALIILVNELKNRYSSINYTQGHEDLDIRKIPSDNDQTILVDRKMDPGEHFPWQRFLAAVNLKKETPPEDIKE